ncbi:MAG: HAD family phosphatase [Bacteroidota bacterium]|nr:HAD family phosphatase [Bacteroidota bacterium]
MDKKSYTIVFDFGGVLIDWNPRYMYRKVFDNETEMEWFLGNVCTMEWNSLQDAGFPFSETIPALQKKFPDYKDQIAMYQSRWPEMVGGAVTGTVEILNELRQKNGAVYGLTNWGADTFPIVFKRFEFLRKMDGIVVSGDEKKIKPNPELYQILLNRYQLHPENCIFIDDTLLNIHTAQQVGFNTIHFVSPENLRHELQLLKVL